MSIYEFLYFDIVVW